jgi:hypothetical protein
VKWMSSSKHCIFQFSCWETLTLKMAAVRNAVREYSLTFCLT